MLLSISFLGLQELKQTDLSTQDKGEYSTQVSVISTDICGTVTTKDVECQFNYLVPSLGMSIILSIILSYLYILYIRSTRVS